MTSLTAIFGNSQDDAGDSEKLLELYWNRAELKKEFANLRDETFKLKDQIRTEQGNTARAHQKYDHIENLLLDPEWVYSVVVFYQLRALNLRCRAKLSGFAEQLKQQREKRQHSRMLEEWNVRRQAEVEALEARVLEQREKKQRLEDRLQSERHRLAVMGAFMRFFRGRSMKKSLDQLADDIASAQQQEAILQSEATAVRYREAPDTQGLDVGSKRSINLMILSYAQELYLHFEDEDLAALAKESGEKSVGAVRYGSKADCDFMLQKIVQRSECMAKANTVADVLKQRAVLLADSAVYRDDDDPIPTSRSVSTLIEIGVPDGSKRKAVDIIGENYWDIANVFSR